MNNYTKENLALLNMKKVPLQMHSGNSPEVFEIEKEMSVDEKIQFIDSQKDGVASYLIELFNKWESEKDGLPKDNSGKVKTVSRKAWYKRNDSRGIIDKDYKIGSYYLFKTKYKYLSMECPTTENGYKMTYSGGNIVDQWFHDLLNQLHLEEKEHFETTDSFNIKLEKVKNYTNNFGTVFNSQEIHDIVWNRKTDVSESNLDIYIKAYQELEQSIKLIESKLMKGVLV